MSWARPSMVPAPEQPLYGAASPIALRVELSASAATPLLVRSWLVREKRSESPPASARGRLPLQVGSREDRGAEQGPGREGPAGGAPPPPASPLRVRRAPSRRSGRARPSRCRRCLRATAPAGSPEDDTAPPEWVGASSSLRDDPVALRLRSSARGGGRCQQCCRLPALDTIVAIREFDAKAVRCSLRTDVRRSGRRLTRHRTDRQAGIEDVASRPRAAEGGGGIAARDGRVPARVSRRATRPWRRTPPQPAPAGSDRPGGQRAGVVAARLAGDARSSRRPRRGRRRTPPRSPCRRTGAAPPRPPPRLAAAGPATRGSAPTAHAPPRCSAGRAMPGLPVRPAVPAPCWVAAVSRPRRARATVPPRCSAAPASRAPATVVGRSERCTPSSAPGCTSASSRSSRATPTRRPPEVIRQRIAELVDEVILELGLTMSRQDRQRVVETLIHDVLGLGPLEDLLANADIAEIMVNGPDQIYVEEHGQADPQPRHLREQRAADAGHRPHRLRDRPPRRRVVADGRRPPQGRLARQRRSSRRSRCADRRVTIRKFAKEAFTIEDLIRFGTLTEAMARVHRAPASRAGSTSSSPAAPGRARRPRSTCSPASSPRTSASSPSRTPPSSS